MGVVVPVIWVGLSVFISDGPFSSPKGNDDNVSAFLVKELGGLNLHMEVKASPKYTYYSYAVMELSDLNGRCLLSFAPPDNFHRVDILVADKSVGSSRASRSYGKPRSVVAFSPEKGKRTRAVFYYGGKKPSTLEFKNLAVECVPPTSLADDVSSQGEWADVDELIGTVLVDPILKRQEGQQIPYYDMLVRHFLKAGRTINAMAQSRTPEVEIRQFLDDDFVAAMVFLKENPVLRDRRRRVAVYATYLAHFSVYLSRSGGSDPLQILKGGNGTCTQQAVSARYIGNLLEPSLFSVRVVSTDFLNLGHTVAVGSDFFADVTNNMVVFVPPSEWNRMTVAQRIEAMQTRGAFGISRDVDAETLSPASFAAFAAEGKPGIGRANYIETLSLWPKAALSVN